jgi:hypothetical protein
MITTKKPRASKGASKIKTLPTNSEAPTTPMANKNVSEQSCLQDKAQLLNAVSLTGDPPLRDKNSWLEYAGKYSENDPLVQVLDAGIRLRDAERSK